MNIDDIAIATKDLGIQMQPIELFEIARFITAPINFLIFGLGNDSAFWHDVNKGGRTVFLEEKRKWYEDIKGKYPFLEAYRVKYDTKLTQWKELIDHPEKLVLDLPEEIKNISWDVILVDGPAGHDNEASGRMKSIYAASKLIKKGGQVFVHDVQREVENAYCDKYLLPSNVVGEVKGFSVLRHYSM